jgi:hypothetical protein
MAKDQTDRVIEEWAAIRREVVGIKHPLRSSDYIGMPRSTLGSRGDLHAGARSVGRVEQNWPPFPYERSATAAMVNWLFWQATPTLKEIFDWHWTLTVPRDKRMRADLMGISSNEYWKRVARVKAYVEGGLAICESVRTLSASGRGINVITEVAADGP